MKTHSKLAILAAVLAAGAAVSISSLVSSSDLKAQVTASTCPAAYKRGSYVIGNEVTFDQRIYKCQNDSWSCSQYNPLGENAQGQLIATWAYNFWIPGASCSSTTGPISQNVTGNLTVQGKTITNTLEVAGTPIVPANLASMSAVQDLIDGISSPDLSDYVTNLQLSTAISALANTYVTDTELAAAIEQLSLDKYAEITRVDSMINTLTANFLPSQDPIIEGTLSVDGDIVADSNVPSSMTSHTCLINAECVCPNGKFQYGSIFSATAPQILCAEL